MLYDNVKANLKDLQRAARSPNGRKIMTAICGAVLAALIFHAGVVVGSHRHYRGHGGEDRDFRPVPGLSSVRIPGGRGFIEGGHGIVGVVQNTNNGTLIVQLRNGSTQTVLLSGKTAVRTMNGTASSSELSAGDQVVVVGAPDHADDAISADLIRIIKNVTQPIQ
jgi:ferric-dicitrate binding protein FerR (iron transport regulator)